MGRAPCCSKVGLHRGSWSAKEDRLLTAYIQAHGEGQWRSLPKNAGLLRCGKSCRLRWMNYLRPGIKRGNISPDEDDLIIRLHSLLGNRWSLIAGRLPGRTDNEIKNYWNTHLRKKLQDAGIQLRNRAPQPRKTRNTSVAATTTNNKKKQIKNKKSVDGLDSSDQTKMIHLPKPMAIRPAVSSISSNNSVDNVAGSESSSSSQGEVDHKETTQQVLSNLPPNWPLFELEDDIGGGVIRGTCDNIEDHDEDLLLCVPDLSLQCPVVPSTNEDDDNMLEKVYDEYLQLLDL